MPLMPAAELVPGHLVREGRHMNRVLRAAYRHLGYLEVHTDAGLRRFEVDDEVFVASLTPRPMEPSR